MKWFYQIILLITICFLTVNAEWIDLGVPGGYEGKAPDITLLNDDANGCQLSVILYGFYLETVDIPEGSFSVISLPSTTKRMEKGNPELPKLDINAIIPDAGAVECEVPNKELRVFDVLPVIPSKGSIRSGDNPDTIPYTFNEIYYNGEWYPATLDEPQEPFVIRDYRGTTVRLNVFQHNPVQGMLEVARKFILTLHYDNPQFVCRDSIAGSFLGIYQDFFLNFSKAHYIDSHGLKMEIITDQAFFSQAWRIRDWKMKKGLGVPEVVTVQQIGQDTASIRQWIINQYYLRHIDFFILVGDASQIPSPLEPDFPYGNWLADPHYVLITQQSGRFDPYADAYISRISGTLDDIRNQIDKILNYEKLPPSMVTRPFTWFNKALIMASRYRSSPTSPRDTTHKNGMKNDLGLKYSLVEKLYDYSANPYYITSALQEGRGFVNFIYAGLYDRWFFQDPPVNPVYSNTDVDNLWNIEMTPFIISVASFVGQFSYSPCFAENWLRKPQYRGAVGFYGSSGRIWHDEAIDADSVAIYSFTHDRFSSEYFPNAFGEVLYYGGDHMISRYGDNGSFNFNTWHIFGDASMQVRFGQQCSVRVSHEKSAYPGKNFDVWVYYKPYGSSQPLIACPNAVVCLWKEDAYYHQIKLTESNGKASFTAPYSLGPMYLTVTKNNMSAYEKIVQVSELLPPKTGEQTGDVELLNDNLNLDILPSLSGKTFIIKIPYYTTMVNIYNKVGKLVKKVNTDKSEIIWRGEDENGKLLAQGVYLVKTSGNEKIEVKRLLLIR